MNKWKKYRFADFCEITRGGSPRPIHQYIAEGGTPWVKIADATAKNSRYISSTKEFIIKEGESKSRVVYPGDLIVSNSATPGLPRFVQIRACIHDGWLLLRDIKGVDRLFLYYLILTEREAILIQGNGSIFTNLKTDILKNHEVSIPPLEEQEAIAGILSSLDDKIDLLHRQNQTLEALTQTLFRHWFIDNAQDDWEEKPLDEIADYLNGLACQKYPPENDVDRLPVLKIKELRNGLTDQSDWATNNVPREYIVENGDVVFSWSGSLMVKIWDGHNCVLNQHLFKVTSERFPKWFYYLWTIYHLEKFTAIAESKATTMGHIKRGDLSNSMTLVPTSPELSKLGKTFSPLIEKMILNNRQSAILTTIRDRLLPKLMSGEVRVLLSAPEQT